MDLNINYRGYTLDPFQIQAITELEHGHSLVLAAPTGSGKTLVAEYLIEKVLKKYLNLDEVLKSETDYKSLILEYCQKNKLKLHYSFQEVDSQNNSHPPLFRVRLEINNETMAHGEGASKKEAEQEASMVAWNKTVTAQL